MILFQENNKQQSKTRFTSPKAVGRKSKTRISKSKQDISDVNKGEIITDSKPVAAPEPQPQIQLAQMQQQSLGIMRTETIKTSFDWSLLKFPFLIANQLSKIS